MKSEAVEFALDLLRRGPRQVDFSLDTLLAVHQRVREQFARQQTLLTLYSPINICGDIHGQYADLLHIFRSCGYPFESRYVFLGDYVDRGECSLEVIMLLFACKLAWPNNVFLLRGNHEIPSTSKSYGFWGDLRVRYTADWKALFDSFANVFAMMPLAALVNDDILCLHGGLSPELCSLDDIRRIKRPILEPSGLAEDILWSDPEDQSDKRGFRKNNDRGCSFLFGEDVVAEKCAQLGVRLIVRAHQVVEKGYAYFAGKRVVTVFSAPGYDQNIENEGAVMKLDKHGVVSFYTFTPSPPAACLPRLRGALFTETTS